MRNPVTRYRFLISGPAGQSWYNTLGLAEYDGPDTYDFRLVAYDAPPAWARDAVVYEIFPDRFARSEQASARSLPAWAIGCDWETPVICDGPQTPHQLYGGDLDGIAEHLDHVAALGVNTVYLTPIFPAESNHRYTATSFCEIDPLLGGEAALARLSTAVHSRGMRLIGDITTNHCGSGHPWLATALAAAPGTPMLFAGDELGLTGVNGEDARIPMPWHREQDWDSRALTDVQRLVHLRTSHPVLRDGGLRWVHVDDDMLVYLRESTEETLLICARRAPGEPVALRCHGMVGPAAAGGKAVNCYGGAPLPVISGAYLLPRDGPTFQVWTMR